MSYCFSEEPVKSTALISTYAVLNIGYSLGLKKNPIIDIAILSFGFLLRVLYGGSACGVPVSSWLFLCVLSLSIFFSLGKRRGELVKYGPEFRESLKSYSVGFLGSNMYVYLGIGLVFYSLWTFERIDGQMILADIPTTLMSIGVVLAMFSCLRYSYDIENVHSDGDPAEVVLNDEVIASLDSCMVRGCFNRCVFAIR